MFRILEVREASQRVSLQGLDNTAADGADALSLLDHIAEQLIEVDVERKWSQDISRRLQNGKLYLKTEYKVHCQLESSQCADYCRFFALSDPTDKDFQSTHEHNMICESCENINTTLEEIRFMIHNHKHSSFTQDRRDDLLHDFEEARTNIYKWKAHVLHSVNQERAKEAVLDKLDDTVVLIVIDWAMKFTQISFREKQSQWFV